MNPTSIDNIDTVCLDEENTAVVIIDQTLLPNEIRLLSLTRAEDMREAIYLLKVRGAPAIGVTAALGMYVLSARSANTEPDSFAEEFQKHKAYLNAARPTAVNLSWALERMDTVFRLAMQKWTPEAVKPRAAVTPPFIMQMHPTGKARFWRH